MLRCPSGSSDVMSGVRGAERQPAGAGGLRQVGAWLRQSVQTLLTDDSASDREWNTVLPTTTEVPPLGREVVTVQRLVEGSRTT